MEAMNATLYDFATARRNAGRDVKPSLTDTLQRIERCGTWLANNGLTVLGFRKPLFAAPSITVSAKPAVYALFSGRYERIGYKKDGLLRYEVWEGKDRINNIAVRWVEVIACA